MENAIPRGNEVSYPAGAILVTEGEKSRRMFIIVKGKARVFKTYYNQKVTIAILGEGEVFGELSFIDAEPRSASVEALTDLSAMVLEGDVVSQEIAGLPKWIAPIIRTAFKRFRDADQKITVLQSINEYQKKNFKTDAIGKNIYLELLRFIKATKLIYNGEPGAKTMQSKLFFKELDEMLTPRTLGLKVFWDQLKVQDLIDHVKEEKNGTVELNVSLLDAFTDYLLAEVKSERFLILSHTALNVLKRLLSSVSAEEKSPQSATIQRDLRELNMAGVPLLQESLKELQKMSILSVQGTNLVIEPRVLQRTFTYQAILKCFDHSSMSLD